jgi:cytosine/adenosine deaminase-related metal-dependent hydrolase
MYRWLKRSGRDMDDCGAVTPVRQLARCGLLHPNLLAVHVNYIGRGDAALLGRHGVSVVHCPRSHAYFCHRRFPWRRFANARVNLCLGTDSLASVCRHGRRPLELNLFEEMRTLASHETALSPRTLVRMVTVNGGQALGQPGELGQISRGALADMIALPWAGKTNRVYEAVLAHPGPVAASLIDGEWAIKPGGLGD